MWWSLFTARRLKVPSPASENASGLSSKSPMGRAISKGSGSPQPRLGRRATLAVVRAFFEQLDGAGLLAEGLEDGGHHPDAPIARRPVAPLEGFALVCDGSGTCCRLYPTTTFLPLDVVRARSACPSILDGGHHPERVFTPIASSAAPSWQPSAVAMIDGRCAYLDDDNRCRIHAAAG